MYRSKLKSFINNKSFDNYYFHTNHQPVPLTNHKFSNSIGGLTSIFRTQRYLNPVEILTYPIGL